MSFTFTEVRDLAEQNMKSKCEWQPLGAHYTFSANTEVDGKHPDQAEAYSRHAHRLSREASRR